jgi:chitin synthase
VVNNWVTASNVGPDGRAGGTVDVELGRKAWEHARRRAEDGCIVLGSLHPSSPSMLAPFVSALPLAVPTQFYTALNVIRAFTHCVTPQNPSLPRYSALAATFTMHLTGTLTQASLALSTSGIDTSAGLTNIPTEPGYRAFDVFYYLSASSASPAEREYLSLKAPSEYALLNRSGTYSTPSYLPTTDDAAAAEDFRENLRSIGIKGKALRGVISTLAALLKLGDALGFLVDQEVLEDVCDDVAGFLDIEVDVLLKKCDTQERQVLLTGIYEALVDWVIAKANEAIRQELRGVKNLSTSGSDGGNSGMATPDSGEEEGDSVAITVLEIPGEALGKAVSLQTVFDDTQGINMEMKQDGVPIAAAGSSVLREMKTAVSAVEADLGISSGAAGREREFERDRREAVLERVGHEVDDAGFLRDVIFPIQGEGVVVGRNGRIEITNTINSSRVWFHLSLHPSDELAANFANLPTPTSSWSAGAVSRQLRAWRLPEWANRRNKQLDFTADFDIEEFVIRYSRLGCKEGKDGVESWIMERGWSNGEVIIGHERVWIREATWWEAECMLDMKPMDSPPAALSGMTMDPGMNGGYRANSPSASGFFGTQQGDNMTVHGSRDTLNPHQSFVPMGGRAKSLAPTAAHTVRTMPAGDYGLGTKGDAKAYDVTYGELDPEMADNKVVTEQPISKTRKLWAGFVWAMTFWIPSPFLTHIGRMKRPDVRMAWREKLVLMQIIILINAIIVFWIVAFGSIICPGWDKVWTETEVSYHQGDSDYWVSHHGVVYDLSDFWKIQHSDSHIETTQDNMQPLAGKNMDEYIVPPLTVACPQLIPVTDLTKTMVLTPNETLDQPLAMHQSGFAPSQGSKALSNINWYRDTFLPAMKDMRKGDLVWHVSQVQDEGANEGHEWVIIDDGIYDLTDYFKSLKVNDMNPMWTFIDPALVDLVKRNPGQDISSDVKLTLNKTALSGNMQCLENLFYKGKTDFRDTPRCQVNNYMLLAFTVMVCAVIAVKFLAALQLGSKRRPAAQDKFVICQVPAYTEGEDQLRKGLDSLTALAYDNKRKLICVICDGMIVGGGNDRPTPKIVLDILGVDPKIDPPALPFRSVGEGSEQLNYGKVYSGLYEYEGNVVPYIVVVKVGKESEQSKSKPGNRGKRDSQIMLMSFLSRVHHRSPMSPLELEMFHQINNVIGVDPELYEYLFMVDADTMVMEDSLNRLVASCANDSKIAGICGETSLQNEERSWWTMIQVYEYYISHNMAKAFESLFGSVTCLPGCFCMYRLRTADRGRPLIISDKVISEYADPHVDTLHKKNLLSLGEDRYLTTLMTKHFPAMSYKFIPDAYALTAAPETWSVLLSQRRRWINSTIHNLCELVFLKDLCGFCCFSMRFVVFIDLFGTIILPATCVYIGYLIYRLATSTGQIPIISLAMLAAVYGLQAVIFIIKRQWQHIGWMIIYLLAFPIYSFVLPLYSFWKQDDFSWGNTRIVIGEKGNRQVVAVEDEGFDPRSIPLMRWDDYATTNNLPGRRGLPAGAEKGQASMFDDGNYEMDDMQSMYSSVKPASTILTGFQHGHGSMHMPPQSPIPFGGRQSGYSQFTRYTDMPQQSQDHQSRMMSMGNLSDSHHHQQQQQPYGYSQRGPSSTSFHHSTDNLMMTGNQVSRGRSPLSGDGISRPNSTMNFQSMMHGPSDAAIIDAIQACLREVDMDTVTKKQLKALTEQRLQTQLSGERKMFLDQQIDHELAIM